MIKPFFALLISCAVASAQLSISPAPVNLSSPRPIGDVTPNTVAGTTLTGTAASTHTPAQPASTLTGTWATGGSATTNKPHFLIEPAGTTSTGWVGATGTGFGINAPPGFTGNIVDFQLNGALRFKVSSIGQVTSGDTISIPSTKNLEFSSRSRILSPADGVITLSNNPVTGFTRLNAGGTTSSFAAFQFSGTTITTGLADGTAGGSFSIGGSTAITKTPSATASLNFALTTTLVAQDLTIALTGAADGDIVTLGVPNAAVVAGVSYFAWVSGTDVVTVRCLPLATGSNPADATFRATLIKH